MFSALIIWKKFLGQVPVLPGQGTQPFYILTKFFYCKTAREKNRSIFDATLLRSQGSKNVVKNCTGIRQVASPPQSVRST
jgi:hypothetical protein